MAVNIDDARKAVQIIKDFCTDFEASYPAKMDPLKGDDIVKLSNDWTTVQNLKQSLSYPEQLINSLTYKSD